MTDKKSNPFDITKAVDFSDKEINDYWVDLSGDGGFMEMVKPKSPMPMFILGGKGSGKTHLMRYYSSAAQNLRHGNNLLDGIRKDGYIGTYLRCGGLNARRFNYGNDNNINWSSLFAYYMDLWLSQLILGVIKNATNNSGEFAKCENEICKEIYLLLSQPDNNVSSPENIQELINFLHVQQRTLDLAINNYSVSSNPLTELNILTAPGKLVFSIPQIIAKNFTLFKDIRFIYLIDELENLTEQQQKYVNTLVRENEAPCSFKIGARLYGIRTRETFSANEVIKEGSEYEMLHLDEHLRSISPSMYKNFAKTLCFRRLIEAGFVSANFENNNTEIKKIDSLFEVDKNSPFISEATSFIIQKYSDNKRPYFVKLEKYLNAIVGINKKQICLRNEDVSTILNYLKCSEYPILEKANIHAFYQDWSSSKNLIVSAKEIAEECHKSLSDNKYKSRQKRLLSHFQTDFFAQLLRECKLKQRYLGIDDFIDMSAGLPRNLLTTLKHIYQWSVFNGESPFTSGNRILSSSQREGVIEASDWFFRDAKIVESSGTHIQDTISRLATFFRDIRFSDKPTECSLSTFSVDLTSVSTKSKETIRAAEDRSLLINIPGGQRDRNTKRIDSKYQINPMLAPRWDLPVHRRGAIALNKNEINALFDPEYLSGLDSLVALRVARMNAPTFGKKLKADDQSNSQGEIF